MPAELLLPGLSLAFAAPPRHLISYMCGMDSSKPDRDLPVWIGRGGEREPDPYAAMTVGERVEMVWPLTLAAWEFAGKAEFLIVGAYAVAGHGLPRATGDIDLWVRPSQDLADVARLEAGSAGH